MPDARVTSKTKGDMNERTLLKVTLSPIIRAGSFPSYLGTEHICHPFGPGVECCETSL